MKTLTIELGKPDITLTAYLHDLSPLLSNASIRPAMLIFPGGSYETCSDREAEPIALAYLAEGYNAFVLRYTVGKKDVFPTVLHDAENALLTLHNRAEEWFIDPQRIAVIGFSAGGHLAACLGAAGRVKPAVLLLGYPAILGSGPDEIKFRPDAADCVTRYTPPTYIFTTTEDEAVPIQHAVKYVTALQRYYVPFELHVFEKGYHGLSLAKPLTSNGLDIMVDANFAQWFPMSLNWLRIRFNDFLYHPAPNFVETKSSKMVQVLKYLLEDKAAEKILFETVPIIPDLINQHGEAIFRFTLKRMAVILPDLITKEIQISLDKRFLELEERKEGSK